MCAVTLALIMAAVSFLPILEGMVPQAEAAPVSGMPMYSWGSATMIGRPTTPVPANRPGQVGTAENWISSATSSGGSFAVNSDGELFGWGAAWTADQMGQGANPNPGSGTITAPTRIGTADNWVQVSARTNNAIALNDQGHIYTWGATAGLGRDGLANRPVRIGTANNWVEAITAGTSVTFAINDQGHLYTWGSTADQVGRDTSSAPLNRPGRVGDRTDWITASGGNGNSVGITESGEIWSWGNSNLGRDTSEAPFNRPGRVGTATNWTDIRASATNAAAVNSAGEIWSWGAVAQIGRVATLEFPADRPGRVAGNNWISVHGGNNHFLAFNGANELWGWGTGTGGQLGVIPAVNHPTAPVFILQTYGFNVAARGGGTTSIMLLRSTPAEGESFLTKDLQMPYGTSVPNLNFTFIIAPHSFNGNTAQANLLPTIPNRVVPINNTSDSDTSAGITTLSGAVDVLAGVEFGQSGVFSYTVTEQQNTSGVTLPSTVTYSQAQYRLNIYVQRDWEASGEVFEVVAITVYRHINDNGTAVTPPEKVEDGLIFTNQYRRTTSGTTEYPGGLRLTKTVVGEFADRTTPFDFDVTLTRTAMCPPTSNFQARIYNADGTLNSTVPITSGVSTHLTLTHRQSVIFQSTALAPSTLTVGTGFTITERAAANFVASVELYVGDNPVTIPPNTLPNTALSTGARIIGDSRNSADFTNAHLFTPPVGIISGEVASLVIAALAAVLIATAMIAINRRKKIERLSAAGE